MTTSPTHQHYGDFNLFKMGRYFISDGSETLTGLMSRGTARRLLKKGGLQRSRTEAPRVFSRRSTNGARFPYGTLILKSQDVPNSRWQIFKQAMKEKLPSW